MRKIANVSIAVITLFVLGVFLAMMPGKVNAGMCMGATQSFGCGDTVTESCTLDGDMTCSEGHGLFVGADGITIDGNGCFIDGVNPGLCDDLIPRLGIYNYYCDDVIIKDLEVKNFCTGIWLQGEADIDVVYRNTIEGCHVHDNGKEGEFGLGIYGIHLGYVYDSIIKGNNVHNNLGNVLSGPPDGCGIYLCGGDRNKIIENTLSNNTGAGIFIRCRPEYTEIKYNYASGNLFGGIRLMCVATAHSTAEYNYSVNNETYGIIVGGPHNTIRYNISMDNLNTTHNAVAGGGVPPNGWGIILARSAFENTVSYNTVCGNEYEDIADIHTGPPNSGESNACNSVNNWNDEGTTGCTYTCNDKPETDFSGKPVSGAAPLKVQFSDKSIGNRNSWSWDFDNDGNEDSAEQNPIYTYHNAGTYTVGLTVNGPGGSDTETKTDYIVTLPPGELNADFSAFPQSGVAPLRVKFTDQSTGTINSYSWDFDNDGNEDSAEQSPTYVYENAGTYTVGLTVNGPGGSDTETKTDYIGVNPPPEPPVADFECRPTTGPAPLEVEFVNLVTGTATSWLWDFGDGETSTEMTRFFHTYENPSSYTVSLFVTGPGGSDNETKTDYITVTEPGPAPEADFSASPKSGSAPLTVNFTDSSTGDIDSWSWDFGDDGTSAVQNPTHTYQNAGSYTVSLTITGPGGSDTETKTGYITVTEPGKAPAADFTASPRSGEAPLTVQFTDETTGGVEPYTYEWDLNGDEVYGDGNGKQDPNYEYTSSGRYTVSLRVTDNEGVVNTETKTGYITVTEPGEPPVADFFASPRSGDAPLTVNFTDFSTGNIDSWSWSFGDGGESTEQNPTYTYENHGAYSVSLTVSGPGGEDTRTKNGYITVSYSETPYHFIDEPHDEWPWWWF